MAFVYARIGSSLYLFKVSLHVRGEWEQTGEVQVQLQMNVV